MAWVRLNNCEAAMQLQGDWVNGMWQREYGYKPCKEYDYFLIPPIDPKIGQVAVVGGNAWIIPKNTPRRVHAKTFVEYAGSLEAHELMARNGMGILAHQKSLKKHMIRSRLNCAMNLTGAKQFQTLALRFP